MKNQMLVSHTCAPRDEEAPKTIPTLLWNASFGCYETPHMSSTCWHMLLQASTSFIFKFYFIFIGI
jgi:hypothetical protein